ncbi:transposase [Polyangium spumosum]|uniref:Transposase n=1 Tax=Polyangium spumosum TaxID=889282 RepID=A0A6N7Q252_9BACT|nr:transposase [Polyangium spumosum]
MRRRDAVPATDPRAWRLRLRALLFCCRGADPAPVMPSWTNLRLHPPTKGATRCHLGGRSTFARFSASVDIHLHADNGGPMKGSTMLATLQRLGVVPSFSRPRVSDDNPYAEAMFRTLKYRPEYPRRPFQSLGEARAWVEGFVRWYNFEHLHSALRFVTPEDRHAGRDAGILGKRDGVYQRARRKHPRATRQALRATVR